LILRECCLVVCKEFGIIIVIYAFIFKDNVQVVNVINVVSGLILARKGR